MITNKKVRVITCMDKNGYIGLNNQLPWYFAEDLKHFKRLTVNSTVLMGRKTFESLSRPLPLRENFVLTTGKSDIRYHDGVGYFYYIWDAINNASHDNVWIIGGAQIYKQSATYAEELYATVLDETIGGDVRFPVDAYKDFKLVSISDDLDSNILIDGGNYKVEYNFLKFSKNVEKESILFDANLKAWLKNLEY